MTFWQLVVRNTVRHVATIAIVEFIDSSRFQPDRFSLVCRESIDRNEIRANLDIKGNSEEI